MSAFDAVVGSSTGIAMFQCAVLQMTVVGTQRTFNATAKYVRSEGLAGNGVAALPLRRGQHWSKLLYARMVNSLALRRRMVPIVAG
jgi:hypothetical protein